MESNKNLNLIKFISNFNSDEKCREFLEGIIWHDGIKCPFCQNEKVYQFHGKAHRKGVYKCAKCMKQFTVTVGTIFESSHISFPKWFLAIYLIVYSKNGISSLELSKTVGVTQKTAWFLIHRIRQAMTDEFKELFSGIVETDETYIGGKSRKGIRGRGSERKTPVVAMIERDNKKVKTTTVNKVNSKQLGKVINENVSRNSILMTDEWRAYIPIGKNFLGHKVVNHSIYEYAKDNAHVNNCESYFSLFKRAIYGTFHSISKKHLTRYCNEFNFRWNNNDRSEMEQIGNVLQGISGKRLVYREGKINKGMILI